MRRILILKPCCLGDVLMATPLLAALAEAFPGASIDWAVGAHSRPAIEGHPQVRELLDASHCIRGELRPLALLRLIRSIRRGRYDTLVVPDRSPILSLVAMLSLIPVRAGLASGWRGFGYTLRVPVDSDAHEAMLYLSLAEVLSPRSTRQRAFSTPRIQFHLSQEDQASAGMLVREGLGRDRDAFEDPGPLVALHPAGGVNPGMTLLSKRWPAERFAALAERLILERNATILLLGGPDDGPIADAMLAAVPAKIQRSVLNLAGRLSLGATGAAIQQCALFIGNDTGVSHLACGVGTPALMIFGPTNPKRYGPMPGAGLAVSPQRPSDTSTTGEAPLSTAQGSTTIEEVSLEQVWTAAQMLLDPREHQR